MEFLIKGFAVSALACVLCSFVQPAFAQAPDVMTETNDSFRSSYADAKKEIRRTLGPVILAIQDKLILIDNDKHVEEVVIPKSYTTRKVVDHVPLGIFVVLAHHANGQPLPLDQLQKLSAFRTLILKEKDSLASQDFDVALGRQQEMINRSLEFIDNVVAAKTVSESQLQNFARAVAKPVLDNVSEAADFQLAAIDGVISRWKESVGNSWNDVHAVIVGGHMPRQHNLALQYFLRAFDEKEEGHRVIYGEALSDEEQAMDLLATHILDREVAVAFFDNPWRMHRDLLSDAAEKYIKKHRPLTTK